MASLSKDSKGRWIVQFALDGNRRTVRLGKVPEDVAGDYKKHIAATVEARAHGFNPSKRTMGWFNALDLAMRRKLADVGLFDLPQQDAEGDVAPTLATFLDTFIAGRSGVKPATKAKYRSTRESLVAYFGPGKPLSDITEGDTEEWYDSILAKRAENTARKHAAVAKVFFKRAVKKDYVASNVFSSLKATIRPNESRFYFLSLEDAQKVLDACPDAEWRLIVALARFGGLRTPSETVALRWGDIDWEHDRITIHSSKTEHHEGGGVRVIPLFRELRPYLDAVWDEAERGAEFVITRYRDATQNLRTQFERIIRRAGLEPWPKLFQNLRSTRETELAERFPVKTVSKWLGNSELVAAKHYLQVSAAAGRRTISPVRGAGGRRWSVTADRRRNGGRGSS